MSVTFVDGHSLLSMFEIGSNLDKWLGRLHDPEMLSPVGKDDAYLKTLKLPLNADSHPRLTDDQKSSVFRLLTMLLRAIPHSRDMVVHILASNSALLSYAVPQIATDVVCAAGAVRSLRLLFRGRCFDGNGDYPISLSSFFWSMKTTPCEGNCDVERSVLRFECLLLMFDMLQISPTIKLTLLKAILRSNDTEAATRSKGLGARNLMATCMIASTLSQLDDEDSQRLHYNASLNGCYPKTDLMTSITTLSITDTKANRSSVCIGEYVLPVKQCPPGGESGEEISSRMGRSNPVSMIRRSEMVRTPSTEHNMVQLSQAVLTGRPIIVQGGSGAGKSFIIRELAVAMNKAEELVELHVNDQTDAKALIGAYVCSDIPGEFIWQYGVLTQAVLGGRWVVVENIDSVPVEFLASIAPLLSRRRLHLPNRNMEVSAHPSFRLFGTRVLSSKSHRVGLGSEVVVPVDYNSLIYIPTMHHFSYDWHYVTVLDMDSSEVKDVLMQKFPQLLPEVVHRLMAVHQLLNDSSSSIDQSRSRRSINQSRKFGLREMIKVAARIRANSGQFNFTSGFLTAEQRRLSFQEVADVFAGSMRSKGAYLEAITELAALWGISPVEADAFFFSHSAMSSLNDSIRASCGVVRIGRVTLSMRIGSEGETVDPSSIEQQQFAFNKYSSRLLEQVAACVSRNEATLLVGETGTGKTTTVQELAALVKQKLVVQNLSLSTDVSDLLGGYRPVTLRQLFLPVYTAFVQLFHDTLSSSQNEEFLLIVAKLFQNKSWHKLLKAFRKAAKNAIQKLEKAVVAAAGRLSSSSSSSSTTAAAISKQAAHRSNISRWRLFDNKVARYEANISKIEFGFAFAFVDGLLVEALREGHWVLLDEINLAAPETLQALSGVLDPNAAVFLTEKNTAGGELTQIQRHPDFRVFAAMNPPTDVGKKELPMALSSRFTELFCDELVDPFDLEVIVQRYLEGITNGTSIIRDIVSVYLGCRAAAEDHLSDSTGQRPRYSLRSLTRSLQAAKSLLAIGIRPFPRAIFEALLLNFQTMLSEGGSKEYMHTYLKQSLYPECSSKELNMPPSRPGGRKTTGDDWVLVKPFWLHAGPLSTTDWAVRDNRGITRFVLTSKVESYIRCLAAFVGADVAPILIQGPTSIGKTSMVEYLAARCGYKCVRINNHEHTDIQEYVGGYVTNHNGQLEFKDGLLVEALRKGHWIILDELNLAPSEVLEALNRLLDDNKELLIPETGEVIKPVKGFKLFATQNPPGIYGGRKPLSRAFKNRFFELSVSDLPLSEVEQIITESCGIAPKFSHMLVQTMQELQIHRQKSTLFQGKYGAVTTRDLIKWGRRSPNSSVEVAAEGYMILAEKLRSQEEKDAVLDILNRVCRVQLDAAGLYRTDPDQSSTLDNRSSLTLSLSPRSYPSLAVVQMQLRSGELEEIEGMQSVAVTHSMCRMWELINRGLQQSEPILLIGETGCGKTSICQLYSACRHQPVRILNCHQSTETADLIGGLRPVRSRESIRRAVVEDIGMLIGELLNYSDVKTLIGVDHGSGDVEPSSLPGQRYDHLKVFHETWQVSADDGSNAFSEVQLKACIDSIAEIVSKIDSRDAALSVDSKRRRPAEDDTTGTATIHGDRRDEKSLLLTTILERAQSNWQRCRSIFEWQDGPLVTAMKQGDIFVMDEINLAEDSVIERLNSVLESGRTITLAEKGGGVASEVIVAHPNFRFLATMNPGGDFGKRELSPALRSRFTEIWVPAASDDGDMLLIVREVIALKHLADSEPQLVDGIAQSMISCMRWINEQSLQWLVTGINVSVREILAWAKFISQSAPSSAVEAYRCYIHGAFMMILDGLGIGINASRDRINQFKADCLLFLLSQCPEHTLRDVSSEEFFVNTSHSLPVIGMSTHALTVGSFSIPLVGPPSSDHLLLSGPQQQHSTSTIQQDYQYTFNAKITLLNLGRIVRAMQLPRAILLEGPPGVGKSSLIANLASMTGHTLVRINLSEHSELSDLLGTDLPASSFADTESPDDADDVITAAVKSDRTDTTVSQFRWCDGVFLQAMKLGHWVLLDELNLAPQSVLEGLNACFDHRHEVFLPDIGKTIVCSPTFRVFCAQNPMAEGGGRKGLPQSFLSRFSRVFIESMSEDDLFEVSSCAFHVSRQCRAASLGTVSSHAPTGLELYLRPMVGFVQGLHKKIVELSSFGQIGGPWEFNLRDIFRWYELAIAVMMRCGSEEPQEKQDEDSLRDAICTSAYVLFVRRMRTREDRLHLCAEFNRVFGFPLLVDVSPSIRSVRDRGTGQNYLVIGCAKEVILLQPHYTHRNRSVCDALDVGRMVGADVMQGLSKSLESLLHCVSMRWPALLVGPCGSGKRRCVEYLAMQTGHVVEHYSASTATDSTDLLGSFEQVCAYRHLALAIDFLQSSAMTILNIALLELSNAIQDSELLAAFIASCSRVLADVQRISEQSLVVAELNALELQRGRELVTGIEGLSDALLSLVDHELGRLGSAVASSASSEVRQLVEASRLQLKRTVSCSSAGFEWVDGIVLRAVQNGHWLVVDNINLCAASVLDRLNSLLEPGGSLLLTEGGEGRVIVPHDNFRIFFCMDPVSSAFGEISRAMRNRCVEIAFSEEDACNNYLLARCCLSTRSRSEEMMSLPLQSAMRSLCDCLDLCSRDRSPSTHLYGLPKHFPRFRLFSRIMNLFDLNRRHGKSELSSIQSSIDAVLPGFSSQIDLSSCSDIVTRYDDHQMEEDSFSVYRCYVQELFTSSFIPQEVFMILVSIGMTVEGMGSPTVVDDLWMDRIVRQAETKHSLQYARYHEMVPKMVSSSILLLEASRDNRPNSSTLMNRLIRLTRSDELSAQSWLGDVICSAMTKIHLHQDYLWWSEKHANLDEEVSASIQQCEEYTRRRILSRFRVLLITDRCTTIEQERLSIDTVRRFSGDYMRMDSDHLHSSLSLFTIAVGISEGIFTADSRELNILSHLYRLIEAVDSLIGAVLKHLSGTHQSDPILAASIERSLHHLVLKRDTLSHVLCTSQCQMDHLSKQHFPWDDISTCSNWLRKAVQRIVSSVFGEGSDSTHIGSSSLLDVCVSVEAEVNRFERSVCAYWQRPHLMQKLRLWKEGGHAVVPASSTQCDALFALRRVIMVLDDTEEEGGRRCSAVDMVVKSLPPLAGYRRLRSLSVAKEWLSLYSTYYWVCTKEDECLHKRSGLGGRVGDRGASSVGRSPKPFVDIASLMGALTDKISAHLLTNSLHDTAAITLDTAADFDLDVQGDPVGGTLYTAVVHRQISRERAYAGEQTVDALVELMVVRNMMMLIDSCSSILLQASQTSLACPDVDVEGLNSLRRCCSHTILLALRYTTIPASDLREIQTLEWAIDSVVVMSKDKMRMMIDSTRMEVLLQLLRIFVVTLETRIFSMLLYLKANHPETMKYTYDSPTLSLLIYSNSASSGSFETSMYTSFKQAAAEESFSVSWEHSVNSSITKLLQPTAADMTSRYIDLQALCTRYHGNGKLLKYLTCSTASISVSSIHIAKKRMLQLMRVVAQSSSSSRRSSAVIHRINQLGIYTLDVLTACRDFYPSEVSRRLFELIASCGHSTGLYDNLLNMQLHRSVNDTCISHMFALCLPPVLEYLSRVLGAPQLYDTSSISIAGRAWVSIGLLRLHLLLPSVPIDPAAKPAIKARLLTVSNANLADNVRADYLCHAVSEKALLTQEMIESYEEHTQRAADIERLNSRGIMRPTTGVSFIELYEDVQSAMDGFLSVSRLHDILTKIVTGKEEDIISSDVVRVVVQEEQAWQANAASFVDRLQANFAAFEDITSTVASAVSNISSGLRLVVSHFYRDVAASSSSVSSSVDADMTMWVDVMQYPFSCSASLYHHHHQSSFDSAALKRDLLHPVACLLSGIDQLVDRAAVSLTILQSTRGDRPASALNDASHSCELPDAKSVRSMTPHVILLHTLSRIEYLVRGRSIMLEDVYPAFQSTLSKFVESYLKGLDERRRREAEKEALYRHRSREQVFESNESKEEEAALKRHFPHHLEDEFRTMPGILKDATMEYIDANKVQARDGDDDGDDVHDVSSGQQSAADEDASSHRMVALSDTFDEASTAEVVGHHARLTFFALFDQLKQQQQGWMYSASAATGLLVGAKSGDLVSGDLVSAKQRLQFSLCENTLVTSKALSWALNGVLSPGLDGCLRGTSLMSLAMMVQRCPTDIITAAAAADKLSHSRRHAQMQVHGKKAINPVSIKGMRHHLHDDSVDRDLLLLLSADIDIDSSSSSHKPLDFHKDPNPLESAKASSILQAIFDRSSELLSLFPGNELLLQVCRVSAKISEFHVSTSIGKMLISVQLLLQKAEEWELYAAKHVSLREEMNRLGVLISEWRELELRSWETLLRSKEVSHARKAEYHWYTLMRVLHSEPILCSDDYEPIAHDPHEPSHSWPSLEQFSPTWLRTGYRTPLNKFKTASAVPCELSEHQRWKMEMMDQVVRAGMTRADYLSQLFSTLESFLSQSSVGEFPARLHLIRLFALQLQLEHRLLLTEDCTHNSNKQVSASKRHEKHRKRSSHMAELKGMLANIVCGIWHYFDQFLPIVRKFQDVLKDPIQTRLKGEVKMGKWDQLNTYALIEYSDKIHRKLNKFLREYETDVLDYPVSALIRKEVMEDFVNKAGELQPVFEVPSTRVMFPALEKLDDEGSAATSGASDSDGHSLWIASSVSPRDDIHVPHGYTARDAYLVAVEEKLPRLSKIDAYVLKMRKYLSVVLDTKAMVESQHAMADKASNCSACYGWLAAMMSEGLCCDVFQRIESLQQKGGQDNASKPMKQRAVRNLLQTLKEHGISHLRSTVSEELRHNTELFSVRAPLGCELMADLTWSCSRPRNVFERGEVYFAKNILELTQLRGQGRSCYSSDISPRDSAIMLSLSENMLVEMTKLRCTIGASLEEFKRFSLALLKASACCSTVDNSAGNRRSSSSTLHDVLHLQMDLKVAVWVNNVMLDNLVQLQSLVSTAALAHEGPHVEEDAALEVLSTKDIHAVKGTLQTILDLLASISMRAEADEHTAGGRSINAVLGLDRSLIGTIALHFNVNDSLDAAAARELLERNHETVSSAYQLFNDPLQIKGMSALASADVVSAVQERLHEMYELISSSRITVHRDDDGSGGNAVSQEQSFGSSVPSSSDRVLRFGGLVSSCIEDCLVSVQKVRSIADMCSSSSVRPFKGCFGESLTSSSCLNDNGIEDSSSEAKSPSVPVPLQDCITLSISSLAACQLQRISEHVTTICGYWGADDEEISEEERISYSLLLQKLLPMCQLVASSFASLFEGVVSEYKSFGKLLYVCLRIFRTLLAKGICSAQQSDGGEDDHGPNDLSGMIFQDDVEGTGMGEGEGKKDVSDQIENEEQLLGLKDDKPKDDGKEPKKPQEKKTLNDEEKDKGVEMAQDFEGEMYDIPEDGEEEGNSDEEEDDKEEPEKELGDANMDDIVDEKQWDEDEDAADDEEGGEQEDKEKFEKDSKMQGEALEGEMRTRDDEDDAKDDQDEPSPDNKEKDESKGAQPEEKDDQPPGDAVNEEDEESVAEKPMGVDVRENKPKEGDGDDDDDDDEEEAGDKGLQESEPQAIDDGEQKDNNDDDLPEEMNLEGSDDGDEGPEPSDEDPAGEDDGIDPMDEDDPEDGGSSENDENDDEQNNQERTALSESCGDLPEQQQEVEEPKEDEDRDHSAVELPKAADDQTPAAYGIRSDKGKDSLLNGADEGDEHNTDDIDKQNGSNSDQRDPSAMKAHQPQGKGGRSQGESRDGQSHEVGGSNRDEQPVKPTSRELEPPNPFKNPGDVNEKWHRRLNLVLPPDGDGDGEDAAESDGGGGDDDVHDVEDGLGKGLYEHASKEEGAIEQVLADAPEEDAVQLPEGGERSEDLPDSNPAAAMGQDDEGPPDLRNDRPDFDTDSERKRERSQDVDRYTGQKAKKKRLNNNDNRVDVDNEDRNEEISNDEDANDDGAPMDEDNYSDTESRSADEAVAEAREVNLSDSSKVVTNESFQFGPRSTVKDKGDEGVLDAPEAAAEEIQCRDVDPREVSQSSLLRGRQLWQHYRQSTESYAMRLCEQLRLILEPTLATRLRGDYRTGKRINMRKVIPYVASGFRKDKIWLRRTKPAKRAYQVMVMIDDSSSMGSAGPLALSSLAMIATAMTRLEIGELSIASFAEDVTVLHKFGTPFTDECGASIVSRFHFEASRTMLSASLHAVKAVFDDARGSICQMNNLSSTAVLQLCFVISDARIDSDNREHLEAKVRALSEQNILVVLVIIDHSGDPKDSIFNTRSVSFVGNKVVTRSYFDDFPFPYYVAIQHIEALPDVLSNALKQWFELIHLQLSNH